MPKINFDNLLTAVSGSEVVDTKVEEAAKWLKNSGLSTFDNDIVDGLINSATAAEIEASIADLVRTFKETKGFSFSKHVVKPLLVLGRVLSVFDVTKESRDKQEELVVEVILDLFDKYTPSIKWVPDWASKWIGTKVVKKVAPSIVDEVFDLLHGEDDVKEG